MNYKSFVFIIIGIFSFRVLAAQGTISTDYEFVNSVYKNHVKRNLIYYYLYYNPASDQFIQPLKDTLIKYVSETDIMLIKNQMEFPDTSFIWDQEYLNNCKVIEENKAREIQMKNSHMSVLIIDSITDKPINTLHGSDFIPIEERQFYYFSKPVWNNDKTLVIFSVHFYEGNLGQINTYIYKKEKDEWNLITTIPGIEWMGI
ncbi:MAG: hypothetical protein IPM71_07885 [Bacteroidota bacterium]|nr:MAG: hypothetical protein IPM71_07885 [Bacteroidota bacterium]